MIGKIIIEFNTDSGQIMLNAPLSNQQEKDLSIKVLAAAIPIAVHYQQSPILKPAGMNGLSKPPIVPHQGPKQN